MKRLHTILILLLSISVSCLYAQEGRFMSEVFSEVEVTRDVTYGVNATVIALPTQGEAVPQPLMLDVYEPVGDSTRETRPLVLVFHTGNFLPVPQNGQILGTRTDSAVVEVCTRLAKYGYTSAAVSYRQGWNPLAETQPIRALGLIQAAYRGVQDARTAIRFFKRDMVENGNQFAVDTSRITIWGHGTGGYVTLGTVGLDSYTNILTTTNGPAKFLLDTDGDGTPETPMVVPAIHGDIEGKTLGLGTGAFNLPVGDTTSYPNHVDYSSDFQLSVNIGGALGDISWLEEGDEPTIVFQSAFDFFAPYEDATLIVPTTGDPIVRVQGGLDVQKRQEELGNNQIFIDANIDDEFTAQARANSEIAGHPYYEGLYPVVNPPNSVGLDEGVTIDWWNPTAPAPGLGIPWNLLPHPSDPTGETSFHEQGLLTNMGMSPELGRTYIDTVMGYFAPRAFAALDLIAYTSTEQVQEEDINLVIAPNPASDQVILRSAPESPMLGIEVFDMKGRRVQTHMLRNHYYYVQRDGLPNGMYVVRIRFEEGTIAKKIMFR
ncbi:MAG: T9SS type A sorting domain-containing protein [Bacteroidota bacterium]